MYRPHGGISEAEVTGVGSSVNSKGCVKDQQSAVKRRFKREQMGRTRDRDKTVFVSNVFETDVSSIPRTARVASFLPSQLGVFESSTTDVADADSLDSGSMSDRSEGSNPHHSVTGLTLAFTGETPSTTSTLKGRCVLFVLNQFRPFFDHLTCKPSAAKRSDPRWKHFVKLQASLQDVDWVNRPLRHVSYIARSTRAAGLLTT